MRLTIYETDKLKAYNIILSNDKCYEAEIHANCFPNTFPLVTLRIPFHFSHVFNPIYSPLNLCRLTLPSILQIR